MEKTVNALGLACPLPVVETKKALEAMKEAGTITVLVDNEIAVQNVSRFAGSRQLAAKSEKTGDKEFRIVIEVPEDKTGAGGAEVPADEAEPA